MSELRKDYVLDRWVIINEKRGKRPHQFATKPRKDKDGFCFFCPGNEDTTPPETGRVEKNGKWLIRWFPNKFAALNEKGSGRQKESGILTSRNAFGSHEVIVETPSHSKQFYDLRVEHIAQILKVYTQRILYHSGNKGIRYVSVFKNHGGSAGTSLKHSHSQLISLNKIPPMIHEKSRASIRKGKCLYCDVIRKESRTNRKIAVNGTCVAFAPFASRYNYEAWVFPKRHVRSITEYTDKEYLDTAQLLKKITLKLKKLQIAYNIFLHYVPKGKDMHFHIEVCPRKAIHAGFELSTGIIINVVSPENAAEFYRG